MRIFTNLMCAILSIIMEDIKYIMDKNQFLKEKFNIKPSTLDAIKNAEESVNGIFKTIEETAELNQYKVMKAFSDHRVSEAHFAATTGYGYDDLGRDTLDKVYADIFETEDGLVRHTFVNGTHTISTALFAVLRPGDTLISVTGKPYDTLEEAIGISGERGNGSLKDYGISYKEIPLTDCGLADMRAITDVIASEKPKAALIQRSKGYGWRPSYSAEYIGEIIKCVKQVSPDTICIVDNCYGEFCDDHEPTYYGADLAVGSLIKNPGGGLAPTGGYIVGKSKYVELASYRMTSVGIGRECGASLGINRQLYQGLFMAPHTVAEALKAAVLCAAVFEQAGYTVEPSSREIRHDIIQSIKFGEPEAVKAFCRGIQKGAPVDSFVTPEPWDMPGYQSQVIMAAGAFVQGASIELSADAPMKEPYIAYMQGGLTYQSAKLGIINALDAVLSIGK